MGNRNRMKKREKVLIFVNFLFGTRIHFSQIMKYKKCIRERERKRQQTMDWEKVIFRRISIYFYLIFYFDKLRIYFEIYICIVYLLLFRKSNF